MNAVVVAITIKYKNKCELFVLGNKVRERKKKEKKNGLYPASPDDDA